jgi:hypothetical protein
LSRRIAATKKREEVSFLALQLVKSEAE